MRKDFAVILGVGIVALFGVILILFVDSASARTLQQGSRGRDVRSIQTNLMHKHFLQPRFVSGSYGQRTYFAVMAFQKWRRLPRDGVAGPSTQRWLRKSGVPHPMSHGDANRVEIWRARQLAVIILGGKVRRVFAVSSGMPGHTTPLGRYRIFSKVVDEWSRQYHAPMPYASYFTGGIALHQSADVPAYPASHGCIRVPAVWIGDIWRATPMHRQVLVLDK
jgi:hypothetical protein